MVWVTAVWGACFVAIQWGLRDAPILWFAALRALVAGMTLLTAGGAQHRPRPSGARAWALITVLGLVNVTIGFGAMFAGVAGLATGTAAVLANAQPLLILLPAWWLYGEGVSRRTAGALVVGFVGLVLVAAPGGGGAGAALSLLAAAAITGGTLLARRLGGLDVIVASGWHFVIGGAILTVIAAIVRGPPVISWTPRFIASLAFLSLVGSAMEERSATTKEMSWGSRRPRAAPRKLRPGSRPGRCHRRAAGRPPEPSWPYASTRVPIFEIADLGIVGDLCSVHQTVTVELCRLQC
jgi:drug/metabolite transporter (DMT)-like permease